MRIAIKLLDVDETVTIVGGAKFGIKYIYK